MADEIRPPKQLSQFGARFPDWWIMKGETSFILDSRCQASVAEGGRGRVRDDCFVPEGYCSVHYHTPNTIWCSGRVGVRK
jgi:hypothetical protein